MKAFDEFVQRTLLGEGYKGGESLSKCNGGGIGTG